MLQIKEDDKFFSRLLSKESSMANPSFRVYYGGVPIGVPFVWEAKPGTPKHPSLLPQSQEKENNNKKNAIFPPLTPPPSFNHTPKRSFSASKKSKIFQGFFPKMIMRHRRQISSASTYSSSSDSTTTTTTTRVLGRSRSLSSPSSLFDLAMNDRDPEEVDVEVEEMEEIISSSHRSMLCFGLGGSRKIRSPSVG